MKTATDKVQALLGIIGGSGLYEMDGLSQVRRATVRTPFGRPSDDVVLGTLDGVRVAFLSRHGRGHRSNPSEINYRANIYALKSLGVRRVISISAVGSMKEAIKPGEVVLPDQFIDLTRRRASTFFEGGLVAHVAFGDPVCRSLARSLSKAAHEAGATVHEGGVYLCIEGPQFSSRGESLLYRKWGVDVIGMTNMPEAKLAREAELCYATVALVTDYDCWHETEEAVTVEAILTTLRNNVALAKRLLRKALPTAVEPANCGCGQALKDAIVTDPRMISQAMRRRLDLLIGRYLNAKRHARSGP
ncbi:MAG TPA: S-methyl-5'-thioadenosine phosphorylase [Nitrospiraceae bacterium]|jgi:5'-methylthioadenosine phosphorylase|nr:S-methyl-5'-thioadenosine phosphorylase [Nitrospiraceae bacterium]